MESILHKNGQDLFVKVIERLLLDSVLVSDPVIFFDLRLPTLQKCLSKEPEIFDFIRSPLHMVYLEKIIGAYICHYEICNVLVVTGDSSYSEDDYTLFSPYSFVREFFYQTTNCEVIDLPNDMLSCTFDEGEWYKIACRYYISEYNISQLLPITSNISEGQYVAQVENLVRKRGSIFQLLPILVATMRDKAENKLRSPIKALSQKWDSDLRLRAELDELNERLSKHHNLSLEKELRSPQVRAPHKEDYVLWGTKLPLLF